MPSDIKGAEGAIVHIMSGATEWPSSYPPQKQLAQALWPVWQAHITLIP